MYLVDILKNNLILIKMNYFKNCTSLDEAKKLYRDLAVKLHPDRSNYDSKADFQAMQNEFENFKPSNEKFAGEFEKHLPKDFMNVIEQLMDIQGLEIELCGSFIWIGGNTRPVKEQIKAVESESFSNARFAKKKCKWYFSPLGYKKRGGKKFSMDDIRGKYGSQKYKAEGKKALAA